MVLKEGKNDFEFGRRKERRKKSKQEADNCVTLWILPRKSSAITISLLSCLLRQHERESLHLPFFLIKKLKKRKVNEYKAKS